MGIGHAVTLDCSRSKAFYQSLGKQVGCVAPAPRSLLSAVIRKPEEMLGCSYD